MIEVALFEYQDKKWKLMYDPVRKEFHLYILKGGVNWHYFDLLNGEEVVKMWLGNVYITKGG